MPVIATNLTSGANTGPTDSISPAANQLIIVAIRNAVSSGTPNVPTVSGCNLTWTQIATRHAGANTLNRITFFRGLGSNPTPGALTFDFAGQTQAQGWNWSVDQFENIDTGGTNGADAVVQSASNDANTSNLTVTLGAFGHTDNATYGFAYQNAYNTVSPGTGFTQLGSTSGGNGQALAIFANSNKTSVAFNATGSSFYIGMAIEIKFKEPVVGGGAFLQHFL